jgi:O-antigen/teichoic acid export membrane protein
VALVTAAVNVAANAVLVPRYFAIGAASSRLIALLVMAALTYVLAQRLWPQRPDFVALAKVVVLAVAGFAVSRTLPHEHVIVSLALKAVVVLGVVGLSVLIGAVDRRDVRRAGELVWRRLARRPRRPIPDTAL